MSVILASDHVMARSSPYWKRAFLCAFDIRLQHLAALADAGCVCGVIHAAISCWLAAIQWASASRWALNVVTCPVDNSGDSSPSISTTTAVS